MAAPPLVSVIVPVYNGAAFLSEALASIHAQAYPALETLVIDDGSTDDSAGIAMQTEGIRLLSQANQGPAAARNLGLASARGDLIAFLDADDLWPAGKLAGQVARLLADPSLEVALGRVQAFGVPGVPLPATEPVIDVHLGSGVFRRAVFERVGGFDAGLRFSEDHDWFLRAREQGVRMVVMAAVTLLYRVHADNMTRQADVAGYGLAAVLKRSLDRRRAAGTLGRRLPALADFDEARLRPTPDAAHE
ncbi:MAG: glycosyltransferase family 2 protein [Anaerolineae bacterium]|nr:glycosyltransferase family 2 protein [Anaerolineae bacterium]